MLERSLASAPAHGLLGTVQVGLTALLVIEKRPVGVLVPAAAGDPVFQARVGAFLQGLAVLDWSIGRNVQVDARWAIDVAEIRRHAAELIALAPDVILASGTTTLILHCVI